MALSALQSLAVCGAWAAAAECKHMTKKYLNQTTAVKQSYVPISRANTWGLNAGVEQSGPMRCEPSSNGSRRTWEEPNPREERQWNMIISEMCVHVLWCECQCCSSRTRLLFWRSEGRESERRGGWRWCVCVCVCVTFTCTSTHTNTKNTLTVEHQRPYPALFGGMVTSLFLCLSFKHSHTHTRTQTHTHILTHTHCLSLNAPLLSLMVSQFQM